jgi:type IV pilus assembly protein PilC
MDFVVRIGTPEGRVLERSYQARDETALRSELEKQGLHVFAVQRPGVGRLTLPRLLGRRRLLTPQEFLIFNQELAALLRAGLPLLQGLDLMLERMSKPRFREVLSDIRDRVRSGEDLSDAFAAHGEHFPRLYPAIAQGRRAQRRARDGAAALHPLPAAGARRQEACRLGPGLPGGAGQPVGRHDLILSVFVVPTFNDFYESLDAELPLRSPASPSASRASCATTCCGSLGAIVGGWLFSRWKDTRRGGWRSTG